MKVVFVGPSLGSSRRALEKAYPDISFRPPAVRGDILRAIEEGVTAIALIDGYFGDAASVWHKEILYALSRGVLVGGGSSMGALRAAECEPFGMVGIGQIFDDYAAGRLIDDEAVALIHGPAELDWLPLSIPRVDFDATIRKLSRKGLISNAERERCFLAAKFVHYTERTYRSVLDHCEFRDAERRKEIFDHIKAHKVELKREDALATLSWLTEAGQAQGERPWTFAHTAHWEQLRAEIHLQQGMSNDQSK